MNKLEIDNKGNIVIYNEDNDVNISFFLEEFFDNSLCKLKADLEICQDPYIKNILIQFADKYENGELDFISDYWQNDDDFEFISNGPSSEFCFNRDGTREFTAHDVTAIHSGFWYAADNLDREIDNLNRYKHYYEGFIIASERIDAVISILKSAPDYESATSGIQDLGLTRTQAEAVMSSRLDKLTAYDTKYLRDRIACCEKLSFVLKGLHTINEKGIDFYAAQLRKSPMFQLSLSSKELFHSNFLYWIWQISPEMFQFVITQLYNGAEGTTQLNEWPKEFNVLREYHNFDLCVTYGKENHKTTKVWLVIENKVKSIPSLSQLNGYSQNSEDAKHLLLSLSTMFPDRDKILGLSWGIANYSMLGDILNDCISTNQFSLNTYHASIISDYANFVSALHELQKSWQIKMDEKFIPEEHLDALRINDLQEKHRFSNLYAELKKACKNQLGIDAIEGSSREVIFTKGHVAHGRNIFIGWGMTRAQGLLEAKIIVEENVVLLVQIQGNQYRHCIELRNKKSADANWSYFSNNTLTSWFFRTNGEESKPFKGFINSDSPLEIRPDKTRKGKVEGYNKYGNEFLYQSITIPKCATVSEVIDMVIYDIDRILQHIV